MFFLQVTTHSDVSLVLFLGTLGMLVLVIGLILFIIFHQRRVIRYQQKLQDMEIESIGSPSRPGAQKRQRARSRISTPLHLDSRLIALETLQ